MKSVTLECDALNPNQPKAGNKKKNKTSNGSINVPLTSATNNGSNSPDSGSFDLASLINDPTSDFYQSQVAALNYFKPDARQTSTNDQWTTVKSKGSRKHSQSSDHDLLQETNNSTTNHSNNTKKNKNKKAQEVVVLAPAPSKPEVNGNGQDASQQIGTDPAKRLRNLRKKLKEIEALKLKDRDVLEKEQLDKLDRYEEIVEQVEQLAKMVEAL